MEMGYNTKIARIGIIGSNSGNGHPISFSAMFNGYDPKYLNKFCKFDLIKEYLPKQHRNLEKNIFRDAKVTCIWTQSKKTSYEISKMVRINHICKTLNEMSSVVDGVILARDDIENHLKIAKIFLKKNIPIFIDKLIVPDVKSLKRFKKISKKKIYMSGSSARYTRIIKKYKNLKAGVVNKTILISGYSKSNWIRYSYHLLEGIFQIYGNKISKVRCLDTKYNKKESYQLIYENGINIYLHFSNNLHLPIHFNCYGERVKPVYIPYNDYFYSIKYMMSEFKKMVKMKKYVIPVNEMISLTRTVIAGNLSRKNKFQFFSPKTLKIIK